VHVWGPSKQEIFCVFYGPAFEHLLTHDTHASHLSEPLEPVCALSHNCPVLIMHTSLASLCVPQLLWHMLKALCPLGSSKPHQMGFASLAELIQLRHWFSSDRPVVSYLVTVNQKRKCT
jgi:hypothetical protein